MLTSERGFTVVEVIVALVILAVAVLGLAGSATTLTVATANAEVRALALYAADDRIAQVTADPGYEDLEDYEGTEDGVPAPGYTRATTVVHVTATTPTPMDYKQITVVVAGDHLVTPIERRAVVAAP